MKEPERYIVITPDRIEVGPGPDGIVVANILHPDQDLGLIGVGLLLRMTPDEARALGRLLIRKADEVEALSSPS